jgi:hypothetical protein
MKILSALLLAAITFSASAQTTEEDAVKEAVNHLFTAMQNGDTLRARLCFDASARMQTARINPQNKRTILDTQTLDDFMKQVAAVRTKNLRIEERITSYEIRIDGPLAVVWASYEFYIDGKISHKGVDAFQLFKSPGGWKIIQLCDTRHKGF